MIKFAAYRETNVEREDYEEIEKYSVVTKGCYTVCGLRV
jgi:hypothetical protein